MNILVIHPKGVAFDSVTSFLLSLLPIGSKINTLYDLTSNGVTLSQYLTIIESSIVETHDSYDAIIYDGAQDRNASSVIEVISKAVKSRPCKVIFISSSLIYGEGKMFKESDPIGTTRDAIQLSLLENIILKLPNYTIIRTTPIYGEGKLDEIDPINNIISLALNKEITKSPIAVFNDFLFSPVYAEDIANLLFTIITRSKANAIFNFGGPDLVTYEDIVNMVQEVFDIRIRQTKITRLDAYYLGGLSRIAELPGINSVSCNKFFKTFHPKWKRTPLLNGMYLIKSKQYEGPAE